MSALEAALRTEKVTPHLWFDKEAREAAEFYTSAFQNSKITNVTTLRNTPSGDTDIVSFELYGQPFQVISAGPLFKFNPSISFHVKCRTKEEVGALWDKLSEGGTVLMELGAYPWSEKYGWVQDKYGLSWQLILVGESEIKQKLTPILMFVGRVSGRAEEAVRFYVSIPARATTLRTAAPTAKMTRPATMLVRAATRRNPVLLLTNLGTATWRVYSLDLFFAGSWSLQ